MDRPLAGGTLHNDHQDDIDSHDIYVENWGTRLIYARIRLREYMEMGPENQLRPIDIRADISKTDTWHIHKPLVDNLPEICEFSNNRELNFHTYWTWNMGGQKFYKTSLASSYKSISTNMLGSQMLLKM